jgi:hypothetical protein
MGKGNVARANLARERNAKNEAGHVNTAEDRKKNAKAATAHICTVCMQSFSNTAREKELSEHVESKHTKLGKTMLECFPNYTGVTQEF